MTKTGLKDKYGTPIEIGDRIRVSNKSQGIWDGKVCVEHGVVGIDCNELVQIKNPDGWTKFENFVDSDEADILFGISTGFKDGPLKPLISFLRSSDLDNISVSRMGKEYDYSWYIDCEVID